MSYIDVVQHTSLSWLIHAWPYLTKRCSIKLKDEGAEIEMTGSQIKQEAPETSTLKMAEIEANDQWSLRSTMQGARIWLPNIEGFFTSLGRLLESAEGQRNTASYDSAEFFSRRLRKNERTLVTDSKNRRSLPKWSWGDLWSKRTCFSYERTFKGLWQNFRGLGTFYVTAPSSLHDRLSTVARNGLVGNPRLQILQQQLQTLHNDAGFRWADIGRILGWEYCLWQNWFWQDIDMKGWSLLILLSVNSCVIPGPTNHFYS